MDLYKTIAWEIGLPIERNRAALFRQIRNEVSRLCGEPLRRGRAKAHKQFVSTGGLTPRLCEFWHSLWVIGPVRRTLERGDTGSQGVPGEQGVPGKDGKDGTSITKRAIYTTSSGLVAGDAIAYCNDENDVVLTGTCVGQGVFWGVIGPYLPTNPDFKSGWECKVSNVGGNPIGSTARSAEPRAETGSLPKFCQ